MSDKNEKLLLISRKQVVKKVRPSPSRNPEKWTGVLLTALTSLTFFGTTTSQLYGISLSAPNMCQRWRWRNSLQQLAKIFQLLIDLAQLIQPEAALSASVA